MTDQAQTLPQVIDRSPSAMIAQAVTAGTDLDKLERLLALQIKWEENEAKKAYVEAMAAFKANPPEIEKDKKVSYKAGGGLTEYRHASLANVTRKINDGLSKHGLSAAWSTTQTNGSITVTCKITHSMGHSEETSLTASPDTSGSKNAIQAIGSTISYLERYTVLALCGLATSDMDDDGRGAGAEPEFISKEQEKIIMGLMKETKVNEPKFFEFAEAETVNTILTSNYRKVKAMLDAKKKNMVKINDPA